MSSSVHKRDVAGERFAYSQALYKAIIDIGRGHFIRRIKQADSQTAIRWIFFTAETARVVKSVSCWLADFLK